ncbi:hypothetical protein [Aquisphaera insulae]|uniref:hypothetical protein n=1 Tax=Aquisphaera insulae TaxID=2712864 RepID=UPI00202DD4F4|nr:hypothetical protein [Aquisphaera insulae]
MSSGAALRNLKQAQAGLKKARQLMAQARQDPEAVPKVIDIGWDSLVQAHRIMAGIPVSAADEAVLTQQLALQRYATALLVRLRRLIRRGEIGPDEIDDIDGDDEV